MDYFEAVVLGVVEGLTEFLPDLGTGHLTIAEKLLGLEVDDPAVTAYTAVIQMGAIAAVVVYFARDIGSIVEAWVRGLSKPSTAGTSTTGWAGTSSSAPSPSASSGFLAKDLITGDRCAPVGGRRGADRLERRHVAGRASGHAGRGPSAS